MTASPTAGRQRRERLRAGLLITGFAALLIGAVILPHGRTRVARDPYAAIYLHLCEVVPGMARSVLESDLRLVYRRQDGVEVFTLSDSDAIRLDVRLNDPGPQARVVAVGDPYFSYSPLPNHLTTP